MEEVDRPHRAIIESHYLPCVEYFVVAASYDEIIWECQEHYTKQSYRNRCRILTAQGPFELSIPIEHRAPKMKMQDVRIEYRQKWVTHHWRTIQTAYGKAPFFEHYRDSFLAIYQRKPKYLLDLNSDFFDLCQKLLGTKIGLKKNRRFTHQAPEGMEDWRNLIHPKKPLENNPLYKPCTYNQIFGQKFVANCSIIDLLFCEGPGANFVLHNCQRK